MIVVARLKAKNGKEEEMKKARACGRWAEFP
jgi:hypothetical protein